MIKKILSCFICAFMFISTISIVHADEEVEIKGTYSIYVEGYDWGCATKQIIVSLDHEIDEVSTNTFKVVETTQETAIPLAQKDEERIVEEAYLSDASGNEVDESSKYVTLDLAVSPTVASPLVFTIPDLYNNYANPYYFTIELAQDNALTSNGKVVTSFNIDKEYTKKSTAADMFKQAAYQASDGVSYKYASYSPAEASDTLVVWLHGIGEGGTINTDPYVTLLANKVTALAGEEFQNTVGGAHVLVPQCPTYWMDKDGTKSNFNNGNIIADGTSYYQESLHELINAYKEEVGANKVVIAGCSNGGYMTFLMAMAYPNEYDAIVPICEAVPDKVISDEQLEAVKDLPMFFIYSLDDTTVPPVDHEIPTIERLRAMNASNLHVSVTEHVVDTSGLYFDENGNPYQYDGHWSWTYFDNNASNCDECGISVFDWIAKQISVKETVDVEQVENPVQPSAPQTGDTSLIGVYGTVMLMAAGYVFISRKENY